jgi:hypothetical protein
MNERDLLKQVIRKIESQLETAEWVEANDPEGTGRFYYPARVIEILDDLRTVTINGEEDYLVVDEKHDSVLLHRGAAIEEDPDPEGWGDYLADMQSGK